MLQSWEGHKKNPELPTRGSNVYCRIFVLRINDNHGLSVVYKCLSSHLQTKCEITFATTVAATVAKKVAIMVLTSFRRTKQIGGHHAVILSENICRGKKDERLAKIIGGI